MSTQFSSTQTQWPAFCGVNKTDEFLILQQTENVFIPLAKRWFKNEEQWQLAITFLESRISAELISEKENIA